LKYYVNLVVGVTVMV